MAAFDGLKIRKLNGGLGRLARSGDAVMGLLCGGVATSKLAIGEVVTLIQLRDAEQLGINESYDSKNKVLVYHHIKEFFRYAPNGTLQLQLAPLGTSITDLCDNKKGYIKQLLNRLGSAGELPNPAPARSIGVVLNPDPTTYQPTIKNGIDSDVLKAVPKAQVTINELQNEAGFVDAILLEGRSASGSVTTLQDLRTLNAPNVSVVVASDPAIATGHNANYAAVGAALGMLAARKVCENLGSVDILDKPDSKKANESYPLTSAADDAWLTAGLSGGKVISDLSAADQKLLDEKGYIYAGYYNGYAGIYFNDAPTCTKISDDYSFIEMNRVWNKAARLIRRAMIPKLKSAVNVNKSTGHIAPTTIADWENAAKKQLNTLLVEDVVSDADLSINPAQNVLSGAPIVISVRITPKGVAREIVNEIGFSNPFNS